MMRSSDTAPDSDRRDTKQKNAIRNIFVTVERPLSPEEVLQLARAHVENIGIATVYRSIKSLLASGWLESVELPGQPARYETSGKDHHHHFHCQVCGRVYELEGCPNVVGLVYPENFTVSGHHLTVLGTCAACNSAPFSQYS